MMMFQDGGTPVFGPLATDRPHQFKTQFIYQFPVGTSVGVNQYVASGLPVSREIGIFAGNNLPVNYLGRMSDGRTPTYSQTDLLRPARVQVRRHAESPGELQRAEPVQPGHRGRRSSPPTTRSTVRRSGRRGRSTRGTQTLAGLIVSQNIAQDPRFLMDNGFQAPIQARFGVKFLF